MNIQDPNIPQTAAFMDMVETAVADMPDSVDEAIASRRSIRGFLDRPVPLPLVRRLLEISARAPSGTNMQPWQGYVVTGKKKAELEQAVLAAAEDSAANYEHEYRYYPQKFFEPFLSRRRKVGWDLYNMIGIQKGDVAGMQRQGARNFVFFDAPVGMIFTIDKRLEIGSWLDYGMFLENLMIAARGYGLHTCPQAAWARYHVAIKKALNIPETDTVVCGMALGYEDTGRTENALRTERVDVDGFMQFLTDD